MTKKEAKPAGSHPLEGIVTTVYLDPVTKKDKEGRARVLQVTGSKAVNKTQDAFTCIVHFIGDRRGYNVQRDIVMRRATV